MWNRFQLLGSAAQGATSIFAFLALATVLIGCGGAGGGGGAGADPLGKPSTSGGGGKEGNKPGSTTTTGGSTATGGSTTGTTTGTDTGGSTGGSLPTGPSFVVFAAEAAGFSKLYWMDLSGGDPVEIPTGNDATSPAVSPNGTRVVYTSRTWAESLHAVNLDGTGQITLDRGDYDSFAGAFSPDSSWVLFTSNNTITLQLYRTTASGAGKQQLTSLKNGAAYGRYSPSGNQIVFVSGDDSDDICRMNADGSAMLVLSATPYDETTPAFSPDGSQIVFTENLGTMDAPQRRVMLMNADGTGKRNLTSGNDDSDPIFTPDGTRILFTRSVGSARELFSINRDGSGLQQVTSMNKVISRPSCAAR